jgi:spore germination cell wall hydrolase CwlJ-like protein
MLDETPSAEPAPNPAQPLQPSDTVDLFFGIEPLGETVAAIEPWSPAEKPILLLPPALESVLAGSPPKPERPLFASIEPASQSGKPNETIAGKGQVTGAEQRPKTPAERLGLSAKTRPKAEKCLANAVYFESRGEEMRGQIAVAQVVLNRAFSGFYPDNVCDVVYQNAHRHLACQFTFACDGIPDVVTDPDAWKRAKQVARDSLDGKLWLNEVGKSTHYHAYWVRPNWIREMRRMHKLGVHTFYRPRAWGDGASAPKWGPTAGNAAAATSKM